MNGILKIGLRLVGPTRCITNNNTTKCLRSMCHVKNVGDATKNFITSAQKECLARYWKKISVVTKKTLLYTSPITILTVFGLYKVINDPISWAHVDMITSFEDDIPLKYSIIPSKIITSSVSFNHGEIEIKTRDDKKALTHESTRELIIGEELDANIQEPILKGKPVPIRVGKFNGLLDNGKLTLKTKEGDTTFTFHHTVNLEVKKSSETLQNEIAANKEKQQEVIPSKIDKFNLLIPGSKMTLKTPERERKWTSANVSCYSDSRDNFNPSLQVYNDLFPIIGNFSVLSDTTVKIQQDESDEVFCFKQSVNIECDKKFDENLQNKIVAEEELLKDEDATKKVLMKHILIKEIQTCEVMIDSGTVLFQTQDGKKIAARQLLKVEVYEDGEKTYLNWVPYLSVLPL